MVFDLAAWAIILVVAYGAGRVTLALLRTEVPRPGDRFIMTTWVGVVICAVALLAVSLVVPLTPIVSGTTGGVLGALGAIAWWRSPATTGWRNGDHQRLPRRAAIAGVALLAVGAAALASDPVTLYDSLVYHVGLMRWLREDGTVPGMALIHNRLGHVSAWFTLGAAFDAGPGANRAANVPLGFALWLVGLQAAIAVARIAARRSSLSDWFMATTSAALIWPVVARGAATPSPDVATNVLIVMSAWSLMVVATPDLAVAPTRNPDFPTGPQFIPLILALGACAMKLFAAPAVVATAFYAIRPRGAGNDRAAYVRRALACAGLGLVILGPFLAANLVASGCPAYPSPVGCLDAPWSVGASRASDYAAYVRDVARWERRGETSVGASLGWIGPWVLAHPVITVLAILTPALAIVVKRRATVTGAAGLIERDGLAAALGLSILGTAFAGWQAPAPRFLYAFVVIVPALALSVLLAVRASLRTRQAPSSGMQRGSGAFVATSLLIGFGYALASQKLNVRSALANGAALSPLRAADLAVPAAPEAPARLFRWRVNDVDVLTPVPRPIADTLSYESVIAFNASFEKCSTAPLPCTPYLPSIDVRLRRPSLGLRGGFVRTERPDIAGRAASCVGELSLVMPAASAPSASAAPGDVSRCGEERR